MEWAYSGNYGGREFSCVLNLVIFFEFSCDCINIDTVRSGAGSECLHDVDREAYRHAKIGALSNLLALASNLHSPLSAAGMGWYGVSGVGGALLKATSSMEWACGGDDCGSGF